MNGRLPIQTVDPDYPGKNFKWTPASESRALELDRENYPASRIADALNAEFPQINRLSRSAVIGKLWRLNGVRVTNSKAPRAKARIRKTTASFRVSF
jgi:hypothetical protein